jgi:hypothetical protein
MASTNRRRFLKQLLGTLAGAAGSVVLVSTSKASTPGLASEPQPDSPGDIQQRADKLANAAGTTEEAVPLNAFLNRGFRNALGGGFRNGAFRNGAGGGFRNGGFANGVGGGFRNGGFGNGLGGGFRNGAFRNW